MTDTNQYLDDLLNSFENYSISDSDKKTIDRGLTDFIAQKLFLKRFRKQKLVDSTAESIKTKIKSSIDSDSPLHFIIFFGGYKHFWSPSAPEADWAEVFNLKFLYEWLSPVVASYKNGAVIEFVSEDWILERMDNYSSLELDSYCASFAKLIEQANNKLPDNFRFKFTRLGDIYNKTEMLQAVEDSMAAGYDRWNVLSDDEKQVELKRSLRSVKLREGDGIDRVVESRVAELAYYDVEARSEFSGDYFTNDKYIYISFSFGLSDDNIDNWLTLGSTYASTVDFWVGRGVLQQDEGDFVNRIVSREQYAKIKDRLKTVELASNDLGLKNFDQIEVISANDWNEVIVNGNH